MQNTAPQVDLLIRNGRVIDPEQGIDRVRDLAILEGKMVDVPRTEQVTARSVVDASGCYVVPGMIDFHTHIYHDGTAPGVNADVACIPAGVTTAVDQGSTGHATCRMFLRQCEQRMVRTKMFLHVSPFGQIYLQHALEAYCPEKWDRWEYRAALEAGGDRIVGLKMRLQKGVLGANDPSELLDQALELANDLSKPLCIHMTDPALPMQEVAKRLRPGDIVAHVFHGRGDTIFDENGHIYPEIRAARERGVLFDMAHGSVNFSPKIAQRAIEEGFLPDIVSTDNTKYGWLKPDVGSLPHIMAQMLSLGMSMEQVVRCVTAAPARALGMEGKIGTFKTGAYGDVTFLKVVERDMYFVNALGEENRGSQMIVPQATILNGEMVYKPEDSAVERSVYKLAVF